MLRVSTGSNPRSRVCPTDALPVRPKYLNWVPTEVDGERRGLAELVKNATQIINNKLMLESEPKCIISV